MEIIMCEHNVNCHVVIIMCEQQEYDDQGAVPDRDVIGNDCPCAPGRDYHGVSSGAWWGN